MKLSSTDLVSPMYRTVRRATEGKDGKMYFIDEDGSAKLVSEAQKEYALARRPKPLWLLVGCFGESLGRQVYAQQFAQEKGSNNE